MEDHAPDDQEETQYQAYHHLTWILKHVKRSNHHQKGEPLCEPHPRLQELLVKEHCYTEDVVIEDNSYICNVILVQWLFVNYMLFPIMYCVVFAIVQNVIFMLAGFENCTIVINK